MALVKLSISNEYMGIYFFFIILGIRQGGGGQAHHVKPLFVGRFDLCA